MKVFKFGGASVKDAAAVRNVAEILRHHGQEVGAVVISAMGKTTNRLETVVTQLYAGADATTGLNALFSDHRALAAELMGGESADLLEKIENLHTEAIWLLEEGPIHPYNRNYDQLVPLGEMLSTLIVSAYLNQCGLPNKWVDARNLICTDNTYREAHIHWELTQKAMDRNLRPLVERGTMVVTQGFLGVNDENFTTTLGREGSDFTAAIIAFCMDATEVVIWKDVPGVLNANPKEFANTVLIPKMSYLDAMELTWAGTSVIHPRTVKPLQNKGIPLRVRSFTNPAAAGTLISTEAAQNPVPSYIVRGSQSLVSITPKDYSFVVESHLEEIFKAMNQGRLRMTVMQNSAVSFSFSMDQDDAKLENLRATLEQSYTVRWNSGLKLITIRHHNPETIARLTAQHEILLEQLTRTSVQFVVRYIPEKK